VPTLIAAHPPSKDFNQAKKRKTKMTILKAYLSAMILLATLALSGPARALNDSMTVPDRSPTPKFFQVGGGTFMIYGIDLASQYGCYLGNPQVDGTCACPAGFSTYMMWSFKGTRKNLHYCQDKDDKKCDASMYACYQ
jgi:hypothetical protein